MSAPARRGFWLPGVRLGAWICLFVAASYGALLAARLDQQDLAVRSADEEDSRARRRAERRQRLIRRFFDHLLPDRPASPPASDAAPPLEWRAFQGAEPVAVVVVVEGELPSALSAEPAVFRWPRPVPMPAAGLTPPFEGVAALDFTPVEALDAWVAHGQDNLVLDALDEILRVPEALLDGAASLLQQIAPRPSGEEGSLTSRILDFQVEVRNRRPAAEFMEFWAQREARYFAKFDESRASATLDEEPDADEMRRDQQKILWEAFRKTYFSRYRRAEERIRDDAFSVRHWRGIDYAVVPPLLAGYLWFRGLDRKFSFGPTTIRLDVEPLRDLVSGDDEVSAFGVEWMPKGSPIGLLFSVGVYEGDAKMDFIGIGTSIGMARKAIALNRLEGAHRE